MAKTLDTIIIGAGHNGLVCAAYLAKYGCSVTVLERAEVVGGCAVSDEFAPGFKCSATFPGVETFDPSIIDELKLARHGLELLPAAGTLVPRLGREALFLPPLADRDAARAAERELPESDGKAFEELDGFLRRLADAFLPILGKPLANLEPSGMGEVWELLATGWLLRRLGRRQMREAMRFLPMPLADVLDERFSSEVVKAAIGGGGISGSWLGPRSPGSTLNLLLHRLGASRGAAGMRQQAVGGTGALTEALSKSAAAKGVTVRTGCDVSRILVEKGTAVGVVLASGEEVRASVVVSNADPKTTLFELVDPAHLEPSFLFAAKAIRSRGTVGIVKFALDGLPEFAGAAREARVLAGRIQLGEHLDELERAFDATKYGRLPERPYVDITLPTLSDPSLAAEGHHVLSAWVQFPPHELREGSWDEARDRLADITMRRIEEYAPGLTERVVDRQVLSPADLEQRFGVSGGCLYHAEPALDQCLYMRPMAGWADYQMPIEGLFLCGSGTHGGGGLTGLAGRNAAAVILDATRRR